MDVAVTQNDVTRAEAKRLAGRISKGEPRQIVLHEVPGEIKRRVEEILREGDLTMADQKKLRRARITELLVDPDPDVAAKAVALSQREDPVQPVQRHEIGPGGWGGHWSQTPPDGRQLEADDDGQTADEI